MRLLIVGNMGYVGPSLVRHLRTAFPGSELIGYDAGYFAHCLTGAPTTPEILLNRQHFGDVRDLPEELLIGVDGVIQLAAVSNDPMGNRFEAVTSAINYESSVAIAKRALAAGARRFVFASSCSMYGAAAGGPRVESDPLNPLTAYARSKVAAENALSQLEPGGAVVTSLRFSTACGMSDRLRLDLVLNDFVACAVSSGEITVLSDGTPWRPLIDVADMARAIEWALTRDPSDGGNYLAVNVGSDEWNYQVKDLAFAVSRAVPGTKVSINENAPADKRSYRVDFSTYRKLAPRHQPKVDLDQSIRQLKQGLIRMNFRDENFRGSHYMRLKVLESHIEAKRLTESLRWTQQG